MFGKAGEKMKKQKSGEGISEEVLCAEYEAVYRYVLSLCRNEAEAQDITQETFLKAMRSSGKFEWGSSLYTWLCAIAKNLWFNNCKKYNREMFPTNIEYVEQNAQVSMEQNVFEKDTTMQIHRILHSLPEPYKEVFSLRMFGQLSFSEIASLFSKTESWARVTYHRARKMISEKMRKAGYDE